MNAEQLHSHLSTYIGRGVRITSKITSDVLSCETYPRLDAVTLNDGFVWCHNQDDDGQNVHSWKVAYEGLNVDIEPVDGTFDWHVGSEQMERIYAFTQRMKVEDGRTLDGLELGDF